MPENKNNEIKILSVSSAPAAAKSASGAGISGASGAGADPPGQSSSTASTSAASKAGAAGKGSAGAGIGVLSTQTGVASTAGAGTSAAPAAGGAAAAAPIDLQNFFNKQTARQPETKIIESLTTQKAVAEKFKPILGVAAPSLQKALDQEKEFKLKKNLRLVQTILIAVFFAAGGMAFYFYSQISPSFEMFGPNTTAQLKTMNENIASRQKEISRDRYLSAQLELNSFSYLADTYFDSTAKLADENLVSENRLALTADAEAAASKMPDVISRVRDLLSKDFYTPTVRSEAEEEQTEDVLRQKALDALRTALNDKKNALGANPTLAELNKQSIRLVDNALKLVGNDVLINRIKGISVDEFKKDLSDYAADLDPLKRKKIQDLVASVLSTTSSDIAIIGSLKNQRLDWLKIINQIETETKKVDKQFNPLDPNRESVLKLQGGLNYTGFDFDRLAQRVSLTGSYRTTNSTNFTRISDLIMTFEQSPYFKGIDMRSFVKTGNLENGYDASFKFDMTLETNPLSEVEQKISLVKKIMSEKAIRNRTK